MLKFVSILKPYSYTAVINNIDDIFCIFRKCFVFSTHVCQAILQQWYKCFHTSSAAACINGYHYGDKFTLLRSCFNIENLFECNVNRKIYEYSVAHNIQFSGANKISVTSCMQISLLFYDSSFLRYHKSHNFGFGKYFFSLCLSYFLSTVNFNQIPDWLDLPKQPTLT